jgi:CheY-like chemotaxis protein
VALQVLEKQADLISVVVADWEMPGLDGIGLLDAVGRRWPDIKRVLLTAYSHGELIYSLRPIKVLDKSLDDWLILRTIIDLAAR